MLTSQFWIYRASEDCTKGKRCQNAYITNPHYREALLQDQLDIHFQSNSKHEEQQPQLAQGRKCRQGRSRKEIRRGGGNKHSQNRGSEYNASRHLTHDPRLADVLENGAEETCYEQDGVDCHDHLLSIH